MKWSLYCVLLTILSKSIFVKINDLLFSFPLCSCLFYS